VHGVRQRNIDGIHTSQTLVVGIVGERLLDAVAFRNLATLRSISAHDGSQLRVACGVREGGQHGYLSDVTQSDDGVPDSSFRG
jgi:hypothetical protein